jgi:hypothetical protein
MESQVDMLFKSGDGRDIGVVRDQQIREAFAARLDGGDITKQSPFFDKTREQSGLAG